MNINTLEIAKRREKLTRVIFMSFILILVGGLYIVVLFEPYNNKNIIQEDLKTLEPFVKQTVADVDREDNSHKTSKILRHVDINVNTFQELRSTFVKFDLKHKQTDSYNLCVPRICLIALPKNFKQAPISSKKKLFVKSLLPLVLRANENILHERDRLLEIIDYHKRHKKLKPSHKQWITDTSFKYRIKKLNFNELKKRIDIIPPSLALGQAIIETGWGTSHSAMVKNSTFGLTVADRVLSYDSLLASVENYMLNMNAHNAYNKMREIRSLMRYNNQKICSIKLLKGLNSYSVRGGAYLDEIANIIRMYNLKNYDSAKLAIADNNLL